MNIIDRFFSGNNFIGFLVEVDGGLRFGYDADSTENSYMVYEFASEVEFYSFLNDRYPNWR